MADRDAVLTVPSIAALVRDEILTIASDGIWRVHAFTLMPDHLHLLVDLGDRLSLSQAVGRLKSKTKSAFDASRARWQPGFFDRRLRPDDSLLGVLLYIHLNPYRKDLLQLSEKWPWFYCHPDDWIWFRDHLADDLPAPEWLR